VIIQGQNIKQDTGLVESGKENKMKLNDILNESREFVIIDPRGNARPVGSKMQGAMYLKKMGGAKRGYHMVLKKNALKARRAIEKNGGNSTNSKIQNIMFDLMYEGKVNEAKLKISGPAYDFWDEREVQRKLRDVKIKIVGDIGGVLTIKGNDKELQKVKDILGLKGAKESVNEAYVESMDYPVLKKALDTIVDKWSDWKKGPMTEPSDIKPAQKELMNFVSSYLKKNIK